jgi:hypothetical protein
MLQLRISSSSAGGGSTSGGEVARTAIHLGQLSVGGGDGVDMGERHLHDNVQFLDYLGQGGYGAAFTCRITPWYPTHTDEEREAASGTRYQRACMTRMAVFFRKKNILKILMFRDVRTVLNERKHLKMVIRLVPDSVSLILGRTE